MLTPQEVSTHVFSKARMGGYNMAMVDEFLDTLTEDYTTLYKENAALKAKLKVLVDKVEEYRATEDSMRATLLTAQKMASQMVQDAEREKNEMLEKVESEALSRKAELEAAVAAEKERLRIAKEESSAFLANMRRLCNSELEFLDSVPCIQMDIAAQNAQEDAVEEQVQSIEDSVLATFKDTDEDTVEPASCTPEDLDAAVSEEELSDAEEEEIEDEDAEDAAEEEIEEPEDLEATRRIDFGDLKFGRNYKNGK